MGDTCRSFTKQHSNAATTTATAGETKRHLDDDDDGLMLALDNGREGEKSSRSRCSRFRCSRSRCSRCSHSSRSRCSSSGSKPLDAALPVESLAVVSFFPGVL